MPAVDPTARLRAALLASPGNVALRILLADTLRLGGRVEEAEREYRDALELAPDDPAALLGLAETFERSGRPGPALVLAERLLARSDPPAQAYALGARLLVDADPDAAAAHYLRAVALDGSLADPDLAGRLGADRSQPGLALPRPVPVGGDHADDADDTDRLDDELRALRDDLGLHFDWTPAIEAERPAVTFADVGGMERVKDEIRMKIIEPLRRPELFRAYGKAVGGGILMYGPPGCGKTHLARATAGEVNAEFISVGIDQVLDMWIGSSERNLHAVFEQARQLRPCVLFFDEVDALGASRAEMRAGAGRQLINQFLAELDGARSNEGVLVLAATNAPWSVDSAFRRPGRFDRLLFVPPPDAVARNAILRVHCRDRPTVGVDYERVAERTASFSGADLLAVVDRAVEAKLRVAMRGDEATPLTTGDLLAAAKQVRPSTHEWFASARNYATYANQAGTYDEILDYLNGRR